MDRGELVELYLPPGSNVRGINERGQIALTVDGTATLREPDGRLTVLGRLGPWSVPVDINDRGEAIGHGPTPDGPWRAFMWSGGRLIDLGTLPGGLGSAVMDINERGHVVGQADIGGEMHLVLWRDGEMVDLGPGEPVAINDHDQIVGTRGDEAFLWQDGQAINLGALVPDGRPSEALDINDRGQIVGAVGWEADPFSGIRSGGRAVLWTAPPRGTAAG